MKNIIIINGKGKTMLTYFFTKNKNVCHVTDNNRFFPTYLHDYMMVFGLDEVLKHKNLIKKIASGEKIKFETQFGPVFFEVLHTKIIIHLQKEDDYKKIPLGIRKRSSLFKLSI